MLNDRPAFSGYSTNDIPKAKAFYADTLGLDVTEENGMLSLKFPGGHTVLIYPKGDAHEPATFTVLNIEVDDIDATVDQLTACRRGVRALRRRGRPGRARHRARRGPAHRLVQGSSRQHPVGDQDGLTRGAYGFRDMRLPGSDHRCGPLLELEHVQRRLSLGAPIIEGTATIPVACIIGTASRAQDFDACFHPLRRALEDRIADIERAGDAALDKAIDVVRVDRAYFVADGHKRVAIARRTGREFIDAHVSHMPTPYEVTGDVEGDAIERTAREGEFRRHSGLAEALPGTRFALSDVDDYGELFESVRLHALEASIEAGRLLPAPEAAATMVRIGLPTRCRHHA